MPKAQIRFSPDDIVESRIFRFPVPSMTLVFAKDRKHALVTLFRFPRRLQDEFSKAAGIVIEDRRTWRTGLEARRDQKKYRLEGSS